MYYDFLLHKPTTSKQLFFIQRYESYTSRYNNNILPVYSHFLKQCKNNYQRWAIVIMLVTFLIQDELNRVEDMQVNEGNYCLINKTSGRNCLSATILCYMYLYKLKNIGYPINICLLDDHIYLGVGKHNEFVIEYHSDPLSYTIDTDSYIHIKNEIDNFITKYPRDFSFFVKYNKINKPHKINKQYTNITNMNKSTLPCAVQKSSVKKMLYLIQNMTYSYITLSDLTDLQTKNILLTFYTYIFHTFIDNSIYFSKINITNNDGQIYGQMDVNGETKDIYSYVQTNFLTKLPNNQKIKYHKDEFVELFFVSTSSDIAIIKSPAKRIRRMKRLDEYTQYQHNISETYSQYDENSSSSKGH